MTQYWGTSLEAAPSGIIERDRQQEKTFNLGFTLSSYYSS